MFVSSKKYYDLLTEMALLENKMITVKGEKDMYKERWHNSYDRLDKAEKALAEMVKRRRGKHVPRHVIEVLRKSGR